MSKQQHTSLYTPQQIQNMEGINKVVRSISFTFLCNTLCFKDYSSSMQPHESECHETCFNNLYSTHGYLTKRYLEENIRLPDEM